ncbi:uncharacterized protein znf365 isoform X4 [Stigmatopora argus]
MLLVLNAVMQQQFCSGPFRARFGDPDAAEAGYPAEYDGFSITGKLPPGRDASLPARGGRRGPHARSLSDGREAGRFLVSRRRTQSVGVAAPAEDSEDAASDETPDHRGGFRPDSDLDEDPEWNTDLSGGDLSRDRASPARGAAEVLQRRLAREVAEKERSLSRQVDVAVTVIAALKEQINASESELEWRERQVLSIQKFLDAAARQETSGKVRIQRFIENLLRRIALAEMLLEDYQVAPSSAETPASRRRAAASTPPSALTRVVFSLQQRRTPSDEPRSVTKSRSAGCQLSPGLHGNAAAGPHTPPGDRRDLRERLARSSRLFCRPEHRDDIWNQPWTGYRA